jgi:hypothetical protein
MKKKNYIIWTIPASIVVGILIVMSVAGFKKPTPIALPKDPLRQEAVRQSILFAAQYRPLSNVVAANEPTDSAATARMQQEIAGIQHFILEISPVEQTLFRNKLTARLANEANPTEAVEKAMNYYRFGMAPDLKLVSGADTIPCVMQHWEQTGNLFNGNRLLLAFSDAKQSLKPPFQQDLVLLYREHVFSGETLRFPFSKTVLNTHL